ncbi:protein suppressor of underreplication [Sabethes cyaneus]|uniref:protein suppressor of underreplication n=1 Tax=Sabethes cyaneus TaxID=53552 RepID=UPI00237D9673|nr:protein suppressor of underreplication [Sabethes cyaneus]
MERDKFALKESLKLDKSTVVPGSVVQYLACHQLEGIRFLHHGLAQHTGVILNDESGLGKVHQVIGYLSAFIGPTDRSLIVCDSMDRIHHWMYHLELLTELRTVILTEGDVVSDNHQIILTRFADVKEQSSLERIDIKLVAIDETRRTDVDLDLSYIFTKLTFSKRIFLYSKDLLDDFYRLATRLQLCHFDCFSTTLNEILNEPGSMKQTQKNAKKIKLFFLTKSVLMRRFRSNYKGLVPLIHPKEFADRFDCWRIANGCQSKSSLENDSQQLVQEQSVEIAKSYSDELFNFMDQTAQENNLNKAIVGNVETTVIESDLNENRISNCDGDNDDDVEAVAVGHKYSEPLFDFENSTEEMPKLEVSDSETKSSDDMLPKNTSPDISPLIANIEIPETERSSQTTDTDEYLEFGQALHCTNSDSRSSTGTVILKTEHPIVEEKYHFSIERLLQRKSPSSSSTDVEILSREGPPVPNVVIVSSSSSSNGGIVRGKSPDLFSDTEDEANQTVKYNSQDSFMDLLLKSPVVFDKMIKHESSSALPKLGQSNVSTPISKLMNAQLQSELQGEESSDDIFADQTTVRKIASPNQTESVFEITDNDAFGNRVRVCAEKKTMSPVNTDVGDVQFIGAVRAMDSPIEISDSQTEVCTPKSQNRQVVDLRLVKSKSAESTGAVKKCTGWLSKTRRSLSLGNTSPKTPTSGNRTSSAGDRRGSSLKRKKLENLFRDSDDDFADRKRSSTSINRRKLALASGSANRSSPKKKCFQERLIQRYNQILVSPSGFDSDFD